MAMFNVFRKMGIDVEIINDSATPDEYTFLDPDQQIKRYDHQRDFDSLKNFDLVFVFDVGGINRIGKFGEDLVQLKIPSICIDHHPQNHIDSDFKVIDETAPATTCLLYELVKKINPGLIDKTIATALYVGLMTDTGSFRFENATENAFRVATELVAYGILPTEIFRHVYESYSRQRMTLLGSILQQVHYDCDGKLAWFTVTKGDRDSVGATLDEIGGFTDFIRSIKGVEVSVMFLEIEPGRIRINFRSKGKVIVNSIARQFGGGGHNFAAGLTLETTIREATDLVVPILHKAVEKLN